MGVALLDKDEPWKVLYRSKDYILAPYEPYECMGDVPNVTFPCATLTDAATGRAMVRHVAGACRTAGGTRLLVGTGDSALTLPFYRACGFRESHRVPNFFLQFYDHPIYEGGRLLSDMVYLSMEL